MPWFLSKPKVSGTHEWVHLTADSEKELEDAARRLRVEIHGKGLQEAHLDLSFHKADLAKRYGAREEK